MKALDILAWQVKKRNFSHAYLIFGRLNLEKLIAIFQIKDPDLLLIEENPIKIHHVRKLAHFLSLKPHSSPGKLVVILGAENMTLEAGNCLLKILEEPPDASVLILQAVRLEKILPTVLSRCQIIKDYQKTVLHPPSDYKTPTAILQATLKERFEYAEQLSQSQNLDQILDLWERSLRENLLSGQNYLEILKAILKTKDLLLTNTSIKLLLENLFLKF